MVAIRSFLAVNALLCLASAAVPTTTSKTSTSSTKTSTSTSKTSTLIASLKLSTSTSTLISRYTSSSSSTRLTVSSSFTTSTVRFSSSSSTTKSSSQNAASTTAPATYQPTGKNNIAMYYGQGAYQKSLLSFCTTSNVDIIPLGFMNYFPAQGNGWPGTNFGNQCGAAVYSAPGSTPANNHLLSSCPDLAAAIPLCQNTYGKKILLSLGGATNTYQLTGAADGIAFANFLWGAYGPRTQSWVSQNYPRPFDGPNGQEVIIDGFDFDIELAPTDSSAGYIAMIKQLRALFATYTAKTFLISGAPQCVVPDSNMSGTITAVAFDILFIQYYNTPACSARRWAETGLGFTYDSWTTSLANTPSANAKLYIGLLGSSVNANTYPGTTKTYYLTPAEAASLINAYYCRSNFGGVMLWEATLADNNVNSGSTYYQSMRNILNAQKLLSCATRTTSTTVASTQPTGVTTDGLCGVGKTCTGASFGNCCSQWGYCGSTDGYCGTGCQSAFGSCGIAASSSTVASSAKASAAPTNISPAGGACGGTSGLTCKGSSGGQCCSQWGYCGTGDGWCGTGCQKSFGICN